MTLAVLPDLGAKVVSLRRDGGSEWLAGAARPLGPPPREPRAWAEHDCSGWDECFPNIAADPASGLADHGELWSVPWEVEPTHDAISTARTAGGGRRFERGLRVASDAGVATVTADYRLTAGDARLPEWAWTQHALLAAEPRMRIRLPTPCRVRLEAGFRGGRADDDVEWLAPGGILAPDTSLQKAAGRAAKLWFEPPLPPWVTVLKGEEWITWRLDRSTTADLGLWVNLGGWTAGTARPLAHVAVEPAYGARDSLSAAVAAGAGPSLDPGETLSWRTVVQLGRNSF